MTLMPGKSACRSGHIRIEELPTNTTPPGLGRLTRSESSNARISDSNRPSNSAAAVGCALAVVWAQEPVAAREHASRSRSKRMRYTVSRRGIAVYTTALYFVFLVGAP